MFVHGCLFQRPSRDGGRLSKVEASQTAFGNGKTSFAKSIADTVYLKNIVITMFDSSSFDADDWKKQCSHLRILTDL